jgi:hypothetical protein
MKENRMIIIKIRIIMTVFIACLLLSGLTAFPLLHEMNALSKIMNIDPAVSPDEYDGLQHWISKVRLGLEDTYSKYPFIAYGTDWLAFGHIVISIFFIGVLINPVKNIWIVYSGIIACIGVILIALICGPIRGIPFYWRMIDSSFGIVGLIPLVWTLRLIKKLQQENQRGQTFILH